MSPLWEAKILLGVLKEQGLTGKGLVNAFEKWAPIIARSSRSDIGRVYRQQTGHEMSDYILVQLADKVVRYNQLPAEADIVRQILLGSSNGPGSETETSGPIASKDAMARAYAMQASAKAPVRPEQSFLTSKQHLLDRYDPNLLLSTDEVASLTGFTPKTIRRWVSRKLLNYIRVGNRLRFRLAAVELFLGQREVRR